MLRRREFPYCKDCFEQHIARAIRAEADEGPVLLTHTEGRWGAAVRRACALARREILIEPHNSAAAEPAYAEHAAAQALRKMLGYSAPTRNVFPTTIPREEMDHLISDEERETNGKRSEGDERADSVEEDLCTLEERYPGTIASIIKSLRERE